MSETPLHEPRVLPALPRRFFVAVLSVWALAGVAFLVLWRTEIAARNDEVKGRQVEAKRVASLCTTALNRFRSAKASMADETVSGLESRPLLMAGIRSQTDLLATLASYCLPSGVGGAPHLSIYIQISDIKTLDLNAAARDLVVWADWFEAAMSEAERAGWPAPGPRNPSPEPQR